MNSWPISDEIKRKYSVPLLLALIVAGLAGNYFDFPIFFNLDFLFGSIFAMLALQFFGLGRGTLAAALIASYSYVLWQHPYAIVIMTAEVAVVGTLMARYKFGMVLADALYWLIIGMPLVFVFYHWVMNVPLSSSNVMMLKQAVNGIANALLASLLFSGFALVSRSGSTKFREIIYNLLAAFVLFPALIMLALASRADFAATDHTIRSALLQDSHRLHQFVDTWVSNRKSAIQNLAQMAAAQSPQQMQSHLEQAQKSDINLLRVGLMDKDATVTAYYPLVDELGRNNIGRNFADGPFVADLKRTLKPMVSEVLMDRIGNPRPMVAVRAPVLIEGQYGGYVTGILSLRQIREQLDQSSAGHMLFYTLLDKNGNVIMTNRTGQTVMTPLKRGNGELKRLDAQISQWLPTLASTTSISERWKNSFYVTQTDIGKLTEWKLILEQPVAPFQKTFYDSYSRKLLELFLVLIGALMLAELLSRRVMSTIDVLNNLTHDLPRRLASDDKEIVWPETAIAETNDLIGNFREMSNLLMTQFEEVRTANELLEQRVLQRTTALQVSEEKHRKLVENSHDIIYTLGPDGVLTFASPAWTTLLGHPIEQVVGHSFMPLIHPDDLASCLAAMHKVLETGQGQDNIEYRVRHLDGSWRWHSSNGMPLKDETGKVLAFEGSAMDITERKQMQEKMHQLAFYDPLTKLPNRRLLSDRLSQAMAASKRNACYCALMMLDLDNFKPLNDTHGHLIGDLLLVEVASRLTSCVREIDTVARTGGDEFVVLLGELNFDLAASASEALMIAEKIRLSLAERYLLTVQHAGQSDTLVEHRCTASIGVVLFLDNENAQEDILKWADQAMYRAKDGGRNRVRFYTPRPA